LSWTPAASKPSPDRNTVTRPKTGSKRSVDCVGTRLLAFEQKAAFEAQTLSIKNRFDDQELKRQASEVERKSDADRLLKAIMSIKNKTHLDKKLDVVSDDVATLSIDVREIKEDLKTGKLDRKREIEGLKFDLQKESEALQVNSDQASRTQATSTSTPITTRVSSAKVFLHFSTSYGGIRSSVPADLIADIYYQDITPADHNLQGSYIDSSTPIPTGKTGSSNSQGESQPGLHSIIGNSQINLSKFQDKIRKLVLCDDSVTYVEEIGTIASVLPSIRVVKLILMYFRCSKCSRNKIVLPTFCSLWISMEKLIHGLAPSTCVSSTCIIPSAKSSSLC
jgi:hypothetical protein